MLWCSLACGGNEATRTLDIGDAGVPVCEQCWYSFTHVKQEQNVYNPRLDTMVWDSVEY